MAHSLCLPVFAPLLALAAATSIACTPQDGDQDTGNPSTSTAEGTAPDTSAAPVPTTGADDSDEGTGTSDGPSATTDPTDTSSGASCGDGELDADEVCDGEELGGQQCADVVPGATGTLTCAADCAALDASGCTAPPGAALVVLNEVTAKGATEGPFSGKGDAIEVLNAGDAIADLSDWRLSDDPLFPVEKTYLFPPGTMLAPGEYLVLVEYDMVMGEGDLPFGISSTDAETLTLVDADNQLSDQLIVAGVDALVSYCRLPDGAGAWQRCDQTFGFPNLAASTVCGDAALEDGEICDGAELGGQTCADLGYAAGTLACTPTCTLDTSMCQSDSAIAINELEATNDRIELYNAGMQAVDLAGWILTDAVVDADYDPNTDLKKLVFPAQASIAGKQYLIVTKGPNPGQHPFGLSGEGDSVTLMKPDLTPVSFVAYADGEALVSYCRLPDGPSGTLTAGCAATFGLANKAP